MLTAVETPIYTFFSKFFWYISDYLSAFVKDINVIWKLKFGDFRSVRHDSRAMSTRHAWLHVHLIGWLRQLDATLGCTRTSLGNKHRIMFTQLSVQQNKPFNEMSTYSMSL